MTSTSTKSKSTLSLSVVGARKPAPYESLLAGVLAGAIEGAVTYPAEFTKTRAQFAAQAGSKVSDFFFFCRKKN